jgi:hypothetical protein
MIETAVLVIESAPFDMPLERAELLTPVRLHLVEPRLDGSHRVVTKVKNPHPGVAGRPLVGDYPRLEQYP